MISMSFQILFLNFVRMHISSISLELDVSLLCLLLVMGSTLLIPPRRGHVIKVDGLSCLPSMKHKKVFENFSTNTFPCICVCVCVLT
jgi:hypothetical protein